MTDVIDLMSTAFQANPYPAYALLRQDAPAYRVAGPRGSEIWLITRFEDARAALSDPRFAKDPAFAPAWAQGLAGDDDGPMGRNMLNSDPPNHTRQRRLVSAAFTKRRVEELRPRIQQVADALVDAMAGETVVDLMKTMAQPLPITVICELLGIPAADRATFATWTGMLLASPATEEGVATRREGNLAMDAYVRDLIADMQPRIDRSRDYDEQPDLLSALMIPASEDQLSEIELVGMVKLLLMAGYETTVNHIGNGMVALLMKPDQLRLLHDRPDLLPRAIEEMLRYDGPIERVPMRFTTEDIDVSGTIIPRGSAVNIVLGAADRDPTRFAEPDTFDITRPENQHLAFGYGIHYCVGAPLARLESQVAFSTLLRRFPEISMACAPEEILWRIGGPNIMRGIDALPVRLRAS